MERIGQPAEPWYDAALLAEKMEVLTALDQDWEDWFEAEGIAPHRISYESLAADPQSELGRLLTTLGLDASAARALQPLTAKLSDHLSLDWAARFRRDQP